jgi:hypothetical protein
MRFGFVLAALIGVVLATAAVAAAVDKGSDRPPAKLAEKLTENDKALWMGEWAACRHMRLSKFAKLIGVKIPSGRTPQVAAMLIAQTAEAPLWNLQNELHVATDGCRNGILWRFYHE